jgi:hypothetical protein
MNFWAISVRKLLGDAEHGCTETVSVSILRNTAITLLVKHAHQSIWCPETYIYPSQLLYFLFLFYGI